MPGSRPLIERFWEKVDRRGPDECWLWTAGTNGRGYGQIKEGAPKRKMLLAHRVSYKMAKGSMPDDLFVLHECDRPLCCNPAHLFLGTNQDNMDDMVKKRRQSRLPGEQNGKSKLTEEQVEEIRRDYVRGSRTHGQPALARKYHVAQPTIGKILRGERWI